MLNKHKSFGAWKPIMRCQLKVLSSSVFLSEVIVMCCFSLLFFLLFSARPLAFLAHTATNRHSGLFERLYSHSLAPPCKGVSRQQLQSHARDSLSDVQRCQVVLCGFPTSGCCILSVEEYYMLH